MQQWRRVSWFKSMKQKKCRRPKIHSYYYFDHSIVGGVKIWTLNLNVYFKHYQEVLMRWATRLKALGTKKKKLLLEVVKYDMTIKEVTKNI